MDRRGHHLKNFSDLFQRLAVATLAVGGAHVIFSAGAEDFLSLASLVESGGIEKIVAALAGAGICAGISYALLDKAVEPKGKLPMAFYALMILIGLAGLAYVAYLDFVATPPEDRPGE